MHSIVIGGRSYVFSGEKNDNFFQDLPSFAVGNLPLERYAEHHLKENSVCIDVGANIGLTAVLMAHYNEAGKVYAFEPSPVNFNHLRLNVERNGLQNIEIIEAAVGAQAGFVNFNLPNAGANSTVCRSDLQGAPYSKVSMLTFDEWAETAGVNAIDLIKIDVEGFEPEVIIGAANTIVKYKPSIYMEFNSITMLFEARINPLIFAEAIWKLFDIYAVAEDGSLEHLADPRGFTFLNIMKHGCINDVLMRLKGGITAEQLIQGMPQTAGTTLI